VGKTSGTGRWGDFEEMDEAKKGIKKKRGARKPPAGLALK